MMTQKPYMRKAVWADAEMLLEWANDPAVRENSFQSATILREEHFRWYKTKLSDPDTLFYIMSNGKADLGLVRFDISGIKATINYSIAKPYRGMGYGKAAIKLAETELTRSTSVRFIEAYVLLHNIASQRIFERLGYTVRDKTDTAICYEKPIGRDQLRPKIGIRVDVNKYVATGHIMRCMAIATSLRKFGEDPLFIVADTEGAAFVHSKGFSSCCLNTDWQRMDDEVECLIQQIERHCIDRLIADSYQATAAYFDQLSAYTKVMYIDDLNLQKINVASICNYNIYAGEMNYLDIYKDTHTKLLLGPEYAPLRPEFCDRSHKSGSTQQKLLILSGGSDPYHVAQLLVDKLAEDKCFSEVEIHVVRGSFSTESSLTVRTGMHVHEHHNLSNLSDLMCSCDLAITAGGSTMYELCACGTPAVSYTLADNQIPGARAFDLAGLIKYCGDARPDIARCTDDLIDAAADLLSNAALRDKLSKQMRKIVDGTGADRIASNFLKL